MDYTQAIQTLKNSGIENIAEILTAISQEISAVKSQKASLEGLLESVLENVGSDTDDYKTKLNKFSEALKTTKQELETTISEKQALEKQVKRLEVRSLIDKEGINSEALFKLLSPTEEINVSEGKILINNQPVKAYAEANFNTFLPVLFKDSGDGNKPENNPEIPNNTASLPDGSPKGEKTTVSPIQSILNRYSFPKGA